MACTFKSHWGERLLKQEPLTNKIMFGQLSQQRDCILACSVFGVILPPNPTVLRPNRELLQGPAAEQPPLPAPFIKELKGALETFNQGLSSKINK